MSDEIPVVTIGGFIERAGLAPVRVIASDSRPPANRMSRKAEGSYGEVQPFEQRKSRPVFSTPVRARPGRSPVVSTQPYHQRVRIHWRDFLGV